MITRSSHRRSTTSSWCEEKRTAQPRAARALQHAGDDVDREGVEAGERLVEDQHLRVVHERRGDLRALLVAERQRLDVVVQALAEPELLEQRGGARRGIRPLEAVQAREVDDVLDHLHRRVQPALLGHVAEAAAVGRGQRRAAEQHLAVVLAEHAEHDAHGGGLAGAVAADEAGEPAGRDREGDVIEHPPVAVALGDAAEFQLSCGHASTVAEVLGSEASPARRRSSRGRSTGVSAWARRGAIQVSPRRCAITAACTRSRAPSFCSTFETWVFTVASPM